MSEASNEPPRRVFVLDTSSIIDIRRLLSSENAKERNRIWQAMSDLVDMGVLKFPSQVYKEISEGHESLGDADDEPFDWTASMRAKGVPPFSVFSEARIVLETAPLLVDVESTTGREDADPYVVGLAIAFRTRGQLATVICEDVNDKAFKTSIRSACGLLDVPTLSMRAFLGRAGIWPREAEKWEKFVKL